MSDPHDRDRLWKALVAPAVVVLVAIPIGLWKGAPTVVLWLGFALLSAAVLLFWETLRLVLDPALPGDLDDGDDDGAALSALDARKRAAVQALRDLEFERSIGRLGEEDHRALEVRYREEARAAMKAIDDGIGPWRARAEAMLTQAEGTTGSAVPGPALEAAVAPVAPGACPQCATPNDDDAVFCKRCGHRLKAEVAHATI